MSESSVECGVSFERRQLRYGNVWVDVLTRTEALDALVCLVDAGRGGRVFTPNVDHVVQAEEDPFFRRAYEQASLSLADGVPLLWAAPLLGARLPEKLSGSDMLVPIARVSAQRGWRVYLVGGGPGAAHAASERLMTEFGVNVVGYDDGVIRLDATESEREVMLSRLRAAQPHLVLVALGAPKQELWSLSVRDALGPAVSVCVGASLDFLAGTARRAPGWVSRAGLEWLHRLLQEPRRLWRRYLLRDPAFISIVLRTRLLPRDERIRTVQNLPI